MVAAYGAEIEGLVKLPRYQEAVPALTCSQGIKHLFALTILTADEKIQQYDAAVVMAMG